MFDGAAFPFFFRADFIYFHADPLTEATDEESNEACLPLCLEYGRHIGCVLFECCTSGRVVR